MKSSKISNKQQIQIIQFLDGHAVVEVQPFGDENDCNVILISSSGKKRLCSKRLWQEFISNGAVVQSDQNFELASVGLSLLKRLLASNSGDEKDIFAKQHRQLMPTEAIIDGEKQAVQVNTNESPLHRLRFRKTQNGKVWLSDEAFRAGERLRVDFTRGHLMQKISSNWDLATGAIPSTGKGKAPVSDNAIDARNRLERALEYVGPELAGLLTDVCCYLKGLESVERDRRWPPRSAKLMLRAGLELLVRHYGISRQVSHAPA